MNRRAFAAMAAGALVGFPRAARATGGLDVAAPVSIASIRVLLATGRFVVPQPIDAWHFAWDGRTYRGTFATIALEDGTPGLLNVLPLDAYLAGVINREVPGGWPDAAQRAQAIVARSYVLGRLRPAKPYDVSADESDQRYGGIDGETLAGKAAVDRTAGSLVCFRGALAHVAYSSCCGGRTAAAAQMWNTPFVYLPSIADPNCVGTPAYAWQATVTQRDVAHAFGDAFADLGALRSAHVIGPSPQERPDGIVFVGNDATFSTTPKALRAAVGASQIRSTFVRDIVLDRSGNLAISGTGRGHGVGLCQWGAHEMALRGASENDVLAFYFPGTSVGTI